MYIEDLIKFLQELQEENPEITVIKGNLSWDIVKNGEYIDTRDFEL